MQGIPPRSGTPSATQPLPRSLTQKAPMNLSRIFSAVVPVVLLAACSKEGAPVGDPSPAATTAAVAAALAPPTLTKSMPMAGGLHIFWKLGAKPCDEIQVERKSGSEAFKVIATVPGTVDNKHDGTATTGSYTYRLRCKAGGAESAYSTELSAVAP